MVEREPDKRMETNIASEAIDQTSPHEKTIKILSDRNRALLSENERLAAELTRVKVERNSLMYLLQSAPHQLVTKVKNVVGHGSCGKFLRKVARTLTGKVSG